MLKKLICKFKGHKKPKNLNIQDCVILHGDNPETGYIEFRIKCERCGHVEIEMEDNPMMWLMFEQQFRALSELNREPKLKLELINGGKV